MNCDMRYSNTGSGTEGLSHGDRQPFDSVWQYMKHALLLPILAAAFAAACSSASAPLRDNASPSVATGSRNDTLSIRLGESASVAGGVAVDEHDARVGDSRCPANAVCVWQGDAHVRIATRLSGGALTNAELHSALEPRKLVVGRYTISMIGMTPYPGTGNDNDTPVLIVRVSSE